MAHRGGVLLVLLLLRAPPPLFGIGHNAFHVFGTGFIQDAGNSETMVTCNAEMSGTVAKVVDEIFLKVTFKLGQTPSLDRIQPVRYGTQLLLQRSKFYASTNGQDLFLWYGFHDADTPTFLGSVANWSFVVSGVEPISGVETFVGYHGHTPAQMPDLFRTNNLRVTTSQQLYAES